MVVAWSLLKARAESRGWLEPAAQLSLQVSLSLLTRGWTPLDEGKVVPESGPGGKMWSSALVISKVHLPRARGRHCVLHSWDW